MDFSKIMDFSLPEFLSDTRSLRVFFLVTVTMGGGAALLAGRAMAGAWRPWWHLALFMLSLHYYLVDMAVCLGFALLGFRLTRVSQMVERYKWINQRTGPLAWRRRTVAAADKPETG
jgi:hypothetical protein